MRLIGSALLASILFTAAAQAQAPTQPPPQQVAAMKKLDFMAGEWKGEAWTQTPQGKQHATGTETVQYKLNGTILVVEGAFKHKETGEPVHNAFGVFSFSPRLDMYRFHAHLANGQMVEPKVSVMDKGLDWSFEARPGMQITYKIRIDEKGEWVETGDTTVEGKPFRFFEMRLKKVK